MHVVFWNASLKRSIAVFVHNSVNTAEREVGQSFEYTDYISQPSMPKPKKKISTHLYL